MLESVERSRDVEDCVGKVWDYEGCDAWELREVKGRSVLSSVKAILNKSAPLDPINACGTNEMLAA